MRSWLTKKSAARGRKGANDTSLAIQLQELHGRNSSCWEEGLGYREGENRYEAGVAGKEEETNSRELEDSRRAKHFYESMLAD